MTALNRPPPGLLHDLKRALDLLLGRHLPWLDDHQRRRRTALQLRIAVARLEQGLYDRGPAPAPAPGEARP